MNRSKCTAVAYIRQRRKCCSNADILLLLCSMTILFFQNSNATTSSLFNNDKPELTKSLDEESVEWEPMKMSTDVVLPAQLPVEFKEDYVKQRKDFDETNLDSTARKNEKQLIQHKMDSPAKSTTDNMSAETFTKQQLNKTPKKYFAGLAHKRTRRSSQDSPHIVKKRNPYIQHHADNWLSSNHVGSGHNSYVYYQVKSHPVQGNYWNGIDGVVPTTAPEPFFIGQRVGGDDEDRVVWERFRPVAARPSLGSIFHDSNPANADTSFLNRRPQITATTTTTTTTTTQRPVTFGSIFHDSNPANADLSFLRSRNGFQQQQQKLQLPSIEVKNENILFRSSPVEEAIGYDDDDVYSDASEALEHQATSTDKGYCAFAIISCCRHDLHLRSKCFTDWHCKFTPAEIKQKCN